MTPQNLVELYQSQNLPLLFWKRLADHSEWKGPRGEGWNDPARVYDLTQYDPTVHNLGVFTGGAIAEGKYLVDFDFDWPECFPFAKRILPATEFGFGRPGRKYVTHIFYTQSTPPPFKEFKDIKIDNRELTFFEFRGGVPFGHMTMLPPSLHPDQEHLELKSGNKIDHYEDLYPSAKLLAIACLLYKHTSGGLHHDYRLAAAGMLLRLRFSEGDVSKILHTVIDGQIAVGCRDMSQKDLDDIPLCIKSTIAGLAAKNRKMSGAGKLATLIGEHGKAVIARIREWLGDEGEADDEIVMRGGYLTHIVNKNEEALLKSDVAIYQRGGCLTRPIKLDVAVGDLTTVRRERGSTMLLPVKEPWLIEQMAAVLKWHTVTADGAKKPTDPKLLYATTLIARGEWKFPVLRGVVNTPTLSRNGRLITTPGFDADSGLLLDFPSDTFPPLLPHPTKNDATDALRFLAGPLRAFPFVDDAAKSVALSAFLTALIRCSLRTSPLHSFDAPTAGTGKSLLAEAVGLLSTGARPPALSQGKSPEEDEKRLSTVLFAGDPVIHIDNCERPITGDFLCSMLTQEVVQARILGLSERRILPSTSLVLASGNNLIHAGDTSRRAVVCRLDANTERPETREFDFDVHDEVLAMRPELVVAGLTVLLAYTQAGRGAQLRPMGSFTDWEWVRGALVWLDCADPADTREAIMESDPKKDELLEVMGMWEEAFGPERIPVADITVERASNLHNKLIEVACHGGWSGKSVGWWLRRQKGRVIDGKSFQCAAANHAQAWWLAGAGPRVEKEARPGVPEF